MLSMSTKTHSLSLWLLKDSDAEFEEAFKDPGELDSRELSIENCGEATLFFKTVAPRQPKWTSLFSAQVPEIAAMRNLGTAAVLLLKGVSGKTFALTFGYGWQLLRQDACENNFGLRVVLNAIDPEKLRSLDVQSLEGVPLHQRTQAGKATAVSEFGLDVEQDILCAATGAPKNDELGGTISGKDSLKISIPVDLKTLGNIVAEFEALFGSEEYKANFAWIDHLSEVRDRELSESLDTALIHKLKVNDFSKTWLAVPEPIDWHDVECFRYQKRKRGKSQTDIDWLSYLASLDEPEELNVEDLKKHCVYCISQSSGLEKYHWTVYKCIYGEVSLEQRTFALTNGKWYQIDADFLQAVNTYVDGIAKTSLTLPPSHENDEKAYNERTSASDPATFALMDCVPISHGGGHNKIEFCDLYTNSKKFIHVKRYGGSSVLSHLFAQGVVSARLFLSDAEFRAKVNERLPSSHRWENSDIRPQAGDYEVVYAVISNGGSASLEMPLFSKINLRNAAQTLRSFGFNLSLLVIPMEASLETTDAGSVP